MDWQEMNAHTGYIDQTRQPSYPLPGHDRCEKPTAISTLRSDALAQHQSDPRHRSNLIPARCQKDDTNRVNLAARTAFGRCDRSRLATLLFATSVLSTESLCDAPGRSCAWDDCKSRMRLVAYLPSVSKSIYVCPR